MSLFDNLKADHMGRNATSAHSQANELNRRGRVADARAKYAEARQLYQQAYDAGCRRTSILMNFSILLMRGGEFERARELMKEISQDKSMSEDTHFELRVNYSICLWRLGLTDKAIETIRYAGKHAKNSSYYSSLGTYLVEQAAKTGDFDEAQALLDEAMDYDDEDAATLDNFGELCRQRGLWAEKNGDADAAAEMRAKAKDYYLRAYKQRPSQITTLYALANFAREDGDTAKAREYVDKAIIHSGSRLCPISIEMLEELRSSL